MAATDAAAVTQATPLRKTASKVASRPMFISWLALAFITTSSVASLRAAPSMAVFGLAAVFLYIVPAIMFLLPTSLVSAELASGWSGGHLRLGHGRHLAAGGFLAVWCQFALGPAWQQWQGSAFVPVRSRVRSRDGFRSTMLLERTRAN